MPKPMFKENMNFDILDLYHQHCTDEAQKAETVLSAVSYIYI